MKTDFVRQEDEEAKENETRFRDGKKQEEELGTGRQDATARYGLLPVERQTGSHGTPRTACWGEADRRLRHATDCLLWKGRQEDTARYGLLPVERQTG
jgi:hypothetical protein